MDPKEAFADLLAQLAAEEKTTFPDGRHGLRKHFTGEVKAMDAEARTVDFVGSDESVDRYGDIIEVAGWDLEDYRKNPVILFGHNYAAKPIGKALSVEAQDSKLVFKVQFATAEENPEADQVYRLIQGGYLKATSVGFIPHAWEDIKDDGQGEDKASTAPEEKRKPRRRYKRQELLELSVVPIPANPNALQMAVSKGVISEDERIRIHNLSRQPTGPDSLAIVPTKKATEAEAMEAVVGRWVEQVKLLTDQMCLLTDRFLATEKAVKNLTELLGGDGSEVKTVGDPGETPSGDPSDGLYDDLFPAISKLAESVSKVSRLK